MAHQNSYRLFDGHSYMDNYGIYEGKCVKENPL